MKVWLVLGSDVSNDPYSETMGVFEDEMKAREYVRDKGQDWWNIVSMVIDEPESWESSAPTCMSCAHGADLHVVHGDGRTVCAVVNCPCENYAGVKYRLPDGTVLPLVA